MIKSKTKPNEIPIKDDGRPHDTQIAAMHLQPNFNGAVRTSLIAPGTVENKPALSGYMDALSEQITSVNTGDLSRAEALLISQAHTLDGLFTELMRRSFRNMGEYLDAAERYMRLALKAQSQCQATLRTLGELKAPKQLAFIHQANMTTGPQQVVNGSAGAPRAEKADTGQNQLLEAKQDEWLDTRTQSPTSRTDQELAAVEKVDRAKDG